LSGATNVFWGERRSLVTIERRLQLWGSGVALATWVILISLAAFNVVPLWVAISGAIVGQFVNGYIILGILRLALGRERFADLVAKMLAERAAGKRDWGSLEK